MVLSSKNSAFFSDVCRVFDTPDLRSFPSKYRTRCSRRFPSGRLSRRGRIRAIKSLQERAYIYKTLSGRSGWPSRDPIGEPGFELLRGKQASVSAGEPNRNLFIKNNPLQNIDPDGLDLITVTYTSGTTVTYGAFRSPNLGQLMGALTNAAGSISGITIKGHACCTMQSFGDDFLAMNSTGTQILTTGGADLAGALKSALAPGAWIYLAGCGSGRGEGNIAQQMSAVLPGVTVSGHQGRFALNVPFCGCALGKRNYYINGELQHSAW